MLGDLWTFLLAPDNRAVLGWLGGGIVVVFGGLWAAAKLFLVRQKDGPPTNVTATGGGVAVGGPNSGSINVDVRRSDKL